MPLHLPKIIHRRSHSGTESPFINNSRSSSDDSQPLPGTSPSASLQSAGSPVLASRSPRPVSFMEQSRRESAQSGSQLHGILKNGAPSGNGSDSASGNGSSGGSALASLHKRMSSLTFNRTDTIETMFSLDGDTDRDENPRRDSTDPSSPSTAATSVSSLSQFCPLPDTQGKGFPFFMMTLSSVSTLSFVALPPLLRTIVLDAVNRAWKRGVSKIQEVDYQPELMRRHKEKGCEGGVWEVTFRGEAWMPTSSEKVSSKRIILNLLTEFARQGYSLTSSFRTSAKDSGKDSLVFLRSPAPPDPEPVFFAVAFYSHDRIWIIDAEAEVGQAVEEGIKSWWIDGVRDARVRERHCRELRLRGAPWSAHSTQGLISSRVIHLTIMKIITQRAMGYDFVGSVDMADKEEAEMPVTFYRRRWGPSTRAVWGEVPEETTG
ncbi:hypothetical protein L202_00140 [Cryptococcus amylolentus CBS 6039]|uniref:Uncharacterized protein n=2 Tax=Cryptococcus amylolentus TaxID=104669 RepID=A0A1E3I8J4_9TREE|nr:hypothetical protein L202_00140 [Cryptococcus amylolentus CBS 6039]ODN84131.1 hypothetical protein L202_00140 [Cryptococcus amylolentus CBS 6039]ODO12003.1 hypothetical protein I350_00787 [Cryptococcus amylolentus CBS 6273]